LPEVPTVIEGGVPGYETGSWYGILAPAQTSRPIVMGLSAEIARIVRTPDIQTQLEKEGAASIGSSPEEFAAHIRKELARWGKVIKEAGISAD
jgi:tripartite-type tricarboxylate transporter receptor subunit TctC